jgi:hypothetical protein
VREKKMEKRGEEEDGGERVSRQRFRVPSKNKNKLEASV